MLIIKLGQCLIRNAELHTRGLQGNLVVEGLCAFTIPNML